MSHVTTSAVITTTGLGRVDVAPEAQLASNERFHEFLESYVHPETPKHSEANQKTSPVKSQTTSVEPRASERPTQKSSAPTVSFPNSTARQSVVSHVEEHTSLSRSVAASKNESLPVAAQKTVPDTSREQASDSLRQKRAIQPLTQNVGDKSLRDGNKTQPQHVQLEMEEDNPVGRNQEHSLLRETSSTVVPETDSGAGNIIDESSIKNNSTKFSNNSLSENNNKKNTSLSSVESDFKSNEISVSENISDINSESVSLEKTLPESLEETSSEMRAENKTTPSDDEENLSQHADQHTLLYQQKTNGNTTTHIEMNVGTSEKIHVKIDGSNSKEHRIYINTDNPEIYQSLKDDQTTLIAALSDNSALVAGAQSVAKADLQISLLLPASTDMSSRDERQEGSDSNRSPISSRASVSEVSTSATERRFLRGVVDLTV